MSSKVDQQAQSKTGRFQVVVNLRPMLVADRRHRFDFQDDFVEANEIWNIFLSQFSAFVAKVKLLLCTEWKRLQIHLNL